MVVDKWTKAFIYGSVSVKTLTTDVSENEVRITIRDGGQTIVCFTDHRGQITEFFDKEGVLRRRDIRGFRAYSGELSTITTVSLYEKPGKGEGACPTFVGHHDSPPGRPATFGWARVPAGYTGKNLWQAGADHPTP